MAFRGEGQANCPHLPPALLRKVAEDEDSAAKCPCAAATWNLAKSHGHSLPVNCYGDGAELTSWRSDSDKPGERIIFKTGGMTGFALTSTGNRRVIDDLDATKTVSGFSGNKRAWCKNNDDKEMQGASQVHHAAISAEEKHPPAATLILDSHGKYKCTADEMSKVFIELLVDVQNDDGGTCEKDTTSTRNVP